MADSPTGSSEGLDAKRLANLWDKKQLAEALVRSAAEAAQLRLRNQELAKERDEARDDAWEWYASRQTVIEERNEFALRIVEAEARNRTMSEALERIVISVPEVPRAIAAAALSEPAEPEDVLPNPGHIDAADIEVTEPEREG